MAINEEALSVNEEYQSTNEELLASKEELQSLNEELNALNSQLQETLERQRTTADDLQNVLYSTDVATIFLDTDFNIRFFTPATKALFNVIPGDIGRPLTDLKSLAIDGDLLPDARRFWRPTRRSSARSQGQSGVWFMRRILPYRTRDKKTEGVVITFRGYHRTAAARRRRCRGAKRQAESASLAKSRFLAAASHDLRQPLQTLALLQGLLAKQVEGEKAQKLVGRIDEALGAMTDMLNTLLDINQIEVGAVKAEPADFPVNDLLDRLRSELTYHAQAAGLTLRVMPCAPVVRSDPRLLEQMIRNLLSNALKYTQRGRVLVGCRRRDGDLRIEIWDTGLGIPHPNSQAIFDEYHQVDNAARAAKPGPGPRPFHRQESRRVARPSDPCALAARQGIGVLDRSSDGARATAQPNRSGEPRPARRGSGARRAGHDPDHRGRSRGSRTSRTLSERKATSPRRRSTGPPR